MFMAMDNKLAPEKRLKFVLNGTYEHLYAHFSFSLILVSETVDLGPNVF